MAKLYADVIINISHEALDRVFQYQVPLVLCEQIRIGMQVAFPFGAGNKERFGYVVNLTKNASYPEEKIKELTRIVEEGVAIESQLIQLASWMKQQYGSTMIQALKTVLPVKDKVAHVEKRSISLAIGKEEAALLLKEYEKKHYAAKARLLSVLLGRDTIPFEEAVGRYKVPRSTIETLSKQQVIRTASLISYRNPMETDRKPEYSLSLNEEQQQAYEQFADRFNQGIPKVFLLFGVTGSGKTEVYMEAISLAVSKGRQAIVLIPEIALTFQTVRRFQNRFGERVSIIHSRLSKGERYDQYLRAQRGELDVVIGPRSALFMPFPNLGLIVMDEEHEGTYKSDNMPKYHAREVAVERAKMAGASVILGSATPSIESYTKALLGEYETLRLTKRAVGAELPRVEIADLREELKKGNRSMFSSVLREKVEDRLGKNEQVMLFINRRGYANFISCRSCGYVVKCPHCDVSLTYHSNGWLKCHYCGHEERTPKLCPSCKSKYIAAFGTGTQKVEEAVIREFPGARVLRMDMDTTKGKHGHQTILEAFAKQEADILVGTQMIVKGHDFPKVTLVGMIAADLSLHSNDYRASERTFQLLTQAAGRAGRGERLGEVVIQTYTPDHYSIITAAKQDYENFYEQEISYRRMLKYPPVYQMMVILVTDSSEGGAKESANALADAVRQMDEKQELTLIGPSEAACSKINDIYRRVIYIKHIDYSLLVNIKDFLEGYIEYSAIFKSSMVLFDFNPMNLY